MCTEDIGVAGRQKLQEHEPRAVYRPGERSDLPNARILLDGALGQTSGTERREVESKDLNLA